LNFTLKFSGNPKPNVTVRYGDEEISPLQHVVPVNGKKHAFEYKFERKSSVTSADCGKILSFEAVNQYDNLSKEVQTLVDCKYGIRRIFFTNFTNLFKV